MKLEVQFGNPKLDVKFDGNQLNVSTGLPVIREYSDDRPHYDGEYIVTPKVAQQTTLATTNKVMDDDVTVLEIPYAEVSNLIGGKTAIIGGI